MTDLESISERNNVDMIALFPHGLHIAATELLHTDFIVAHSLPGKQIPKLITTQTITV